MQLLALEQDALVREHVLGSNHEARHLRVLGHAAGGHGRDLVRGLLGAEERAGVEAEADLAVVGGARRRPDDFQIEGRQKLQRIGRHEIEVVRHDGLQHLRRHLVEGREVREALFFRDPLDGVLAVLFCVCRRAGEREGEDEGAGEHGACAVISSEMRPHSFCSVHRSYRARRCQSVRP